MPIVQIDDLKIGQIISFQSKETHNVATRVGTIVAIGDYKVVRTIEDIVPRYQSMRRQFPTMAPIDELVYFVLQIAQDDKTSLYVVAKEWIEPTSIQVIEQIKTFKIKLYDITEMQIIEVLELLRTHGFKCSKD